MKRTVAGFLVTGLLAGLAAFNSGAQAPTVSRIRVTFATTSDDKDWNTQVRDRIVCGGQDFARLECCSADRRGDHWDDGSTHTREMQILNAIPKATMPTCTFVVGSRATGNDNWRFIPSLQVEYSDGTTFNRTYPQTTLNSRGGNAVQREYPVGH
jgi:hypothetical protein